MMELFETLNNNLNIIFDQIAVTYGYGLNLLNLTMAQIPSWILWICISLFIITGLWLVWQGLSRKSLLLKPKALRLDPDNPAHLSGREADLQTLLDAVISNPLVFLEGEAGVGKSAIIRAGLIPQLQELTIETPLIPIYIRCYNTDWDLGLRQQLNISLWESIDTQLLEQLQINSQTILQEQLLEIDGLQHFCNKIYNTIGSRLLFIFDQFDDYIVINYSHFLQQNRWITTQELIAQNYFWKDIHKLLDLKVPKELNILSCLFITRRKWAMALAAVRFKEPVQLNLDLVATDAIAELLEQITTPNKTQNNAIIANPNVGWPALKDLLIQDLNNQGRILPIQAAVALKGLATLPELSVGIYEFIGRLEGLETSAIKKAVIIAAKAAKIPTVQIQDALMALIDETLPLLPKARIADQNTVLAAARVDTTLGLPMLNALQHSDLIRPIFASTAIAEETSSTNLKTTASQTWSLYHDYLASSIVTMHRHANRWQRLLQARQRTFYAAEGPYAKWRSLLTPGELVYLLRETWHSRINWQGYRLFGILGIIRTLPNVLTLLIVIVGANQALNWQAHHEATHILTKLENLSANNRLENETINKTTDGSIHTTTIDGETLRQFWLLAAASSRLKLAFIDNTLQDNKPHTKLIQHIDILVQATFGLDPTYKLRTKALKLILTPNTKTQQDRYYPALLAAHIYFTAPKIFTDFKEAIILHLNAALAITTDNKATIKLSQALGRFESNLSPTQAQTAAQHILKAIRLANNHPSIIQLSQVLITLNDRMTPTQIRAGTTHLVTAMQSTTNSHLLATLGTILTAYDTKLPPDQAQQGAKRLVTIIGTNNDNQDMHRLAHILQHLSTQLPAPQAQTIATLIVQIMDSSRNLPQLTYLQNTLEQLAPRLPTPLPIIKPLVTSLRDSHEPAHQALLLQTIMQFGKALPVQQLQAMCTYLQTTISTTEDTDQIAALGWAFGELTKQILTRTNSQSVSEAATKSIELVTQRLITIMSTRTVPRHLAELGNALAAFGKWLPTQQAETGSTKIVAAMQTSTAPRQLISLGNALVNLGKQLPKLAAQDGSERILIIMESNIASEQLIPLGEIIAALGPRLPKLQTLAQRLVVAISSQESERLPAFSQLMHKLGKYLTHNETASIAKQMLEAMQLTDGNNLVVLGQTLGELLHIQSNATHPYTQQAQAGAQRIVSIMQTSTNWKHLATLGRVLSLIVQTQRAIGKTLNVETQAGSERIVEAIQANTVPQQLAILGQVLGQLEQSTTAPTKTKLVAERIITLLRTTTEPKRLNALVTAWKTIIPHIPKSEIKNLAPQIATAMQASTNELQIISLGQILTSFGNMLPQAQAQLAATRILELMHTLNENQPLLAMAHILSDLGTQLPPELAQASATKLILAMRSSKDPDHLEAFSQALIDLISIQNTTTNNENPIAKQIQDGIQYLIGVLKQATNQPDIDRLTTILSNLSQHLPPAQLQYLAQSLTMAMTNTNNWQRLVILGNALNQLGPLLPPQQAQTAAHRLITAMQNTTSAKAFLHQAKILATLQLAPNPKLIPPLLDVLKAPLAIGDTQKHILNIFSQLADTKFTDSNAFVIWCGANGISGLNTLPNSPFQ